MRFTAHLAAALALTLASNGWAQVMPAGEFAARDGRPGNGKAWRISDAQGAALAVRLTAIAEKSAIAIDYEHQSILSASNGQPAPAAGWMNRFEWRAGLGMFAAVRWTDRARALIDGDEYRYISPVLLFDNSGQVIGLHNAALVSTPALIGMDAVKAALATGFVDTAQFSTALSQPPKKQESDMDLLMLVALLGLNAGASAQDVTSAIKGLMDRPLLPTALSAQLGLQPNADEAAALAALTALSNKLGTPDPATLQAMTALQAELTSLRNEVTDRTVCELVDGAIAAHKLAPAQRDWAVDLGKTNLVKLNAFITTAPAIAGLAGQTGGRSDAGQGAGDDDPQLIAREALSLQTTQAALGVRLTTAQAVDMAIAARKAAR